jgi:uncharacterized metal-binding protein YceD (DUF177 family)
VTSWKLRRFRRRLYDELRKELPEIDSIALGRLANRLERLMMVQAFSLVQIEHAADCACQRCIEDLHLEVYRHRCEMLVDRQMAEEHD